MLCSLTGAAYTHRTHAVEHKRNFKVEVCHYHRAMTAISLPVQYMFRCDIGIDDYRSMEIYPNSVVGFVQISRAAVES